jgi:hypothetical protein
MIGDRNVGANSYGGAVSLTNCNVTLTGNAYGAIGSDDTSLRGSIASAKNTTIKVTGDTNEIAYAYFGGVTTLDTSTVNGSGNNNYGLSAYSD